MVPYQLSEPTTCQPACAAWPATLLASPEMLELLKTSTTTCERSKAGLCGAWCCGFGLGFVDGECGARAECCADGVTRRSVGSWCRVATQAIPAMATATIDKIITGDGNTTPRWSRARAAATARPRTRGVARSAPAAARRASGGGDARATGRRPAPPDGR